MLRLSKLADYGILILVHVAERPEDGLFTTRALASSTGLPLPTVSKVVKVLVRHGLLKSRRGSLGGYALARAPNTISVVEIIQAFEGPVALTACTSHSVRRGGCELEPTCLSRRPWHRLNTIVVGVLSDVMLSDMNGAATQRTGPAPKLRGA